jgi:hypothetical protein
MQEISNALATQVETQRLSSFLVASLTRFLQHSCKSADYLGLLSTCLSRSFSSPVLPQLASSCLSAAWPLAFLQLISPSPLLSAASTLSSFFLFEFALGRPRRCLDKCVNVDGKFLECLLRGCETHTDDNARVLQVPLFRQCFAMLSHDVPCEVVSSSTLSNTDAK